MASLKAPKPQFEIPDCCKSIIIIIEVDKQPNALAYIMRDALVRLFKGVTDLEIHNTQERNHDNCHFEMKRDPETPLTDDEKDFLNKMHNMIGIKVSFTE